MKKNQPIFNLEKCGWWTGSAEILARTLPNVWILLRYYQIMGRGAWWKTCLGEGVVGVVGV